MSDTRHTGVGLVVRIFPKRSRSNRHIPFGNTLTRLGLVVISALYISLLLGTPQVHAITEGDGTAGYPYQVLSCADFMEINTHPDAYYDLTNDLDCSSDGNSIMITDFSGVLDGNDHSIQVSLDTNGSSTGLFKQLSAATIHDLTVTGTLSTTGSDAGLLAGQMYATTINNVHTSGTINASSDRVGGVFGSTGCDSTITNSSSSANVTGNYQTGGFTGVDGCEGPGSTYTNTFASGSVGGAGSVGGFIGEGHGVTLNQVYAEGDVTGSDNNVGGLAGYLSNWLNTQLVFHSYATGAASGTSFVGGLVGYIDRGTISQTYATGAALGTDFVGGFIGYGNDSLKIRDSYARGDAILTDDAGSASSFIAVAEGSVVVWNSYASGEASTPNGLAGAIIADGYSDRLHNVFWDTETTGLIDACGNTPCDGTGLTSSEMKTASSFVDSGWNFDTIWGTNESINDGYPYLLGGDDIIPGQVSGPVETILSENQFHGGGEPQGWNCDDCEWEYQLPFSFDFYGHSYGYAYVSSNGYINFGGGHDGNYDFPIEDGVGDPLIAAVSADLNTACGNEGEDIYITDNNDGTVIFRWQVSPYANCEITMNFEIVLHDDGKFEINYGNMSGDLENSAGVGVNDGDSSYVLSEYDGRTNFDNLNTSSWQPYEYSRADGGEGIFDGLRLLIVESQDQNSLAYLDTNNIDYTVVDPDTFASMSPDDFLGYNAVIYDSGNDPQYDKLRAGLPALSSALNQHPIVVSIRVAGNVGNQDDIDFLGTDFVQEYGEYANIADSNSPMITGSGIGGYILTSSDFDNWDSTFHGWLDNVPSSQDGYNVILDNEFGPSGIEYNYEQGHVIVDTLTAIDGGWGEGNPRVADNYIRYIAHEVQAIQAADGDNDGIPDSTENAAPHGGDANNDGTPDSEQANVGSVVNPVTGNYAVLAVDEGCTIESLDLLSESDVNNEGDSEYNYPAGLMDFRLSCGTPGYTATVHQYYYGVRGDFTTRKFKPGSGYFSIEGATTSDETIADQAVKVATYQVQDASNLDLDGATDGTIEDPAGLGENTTLGIASDLASSGQPLVPYYILATLLFSIPVGMMTNKRRMANNANK